MPFVFVVTATGTAYVSIASEYGPEEEEEEEACIYFFASRAGKKGKRTEGIQIVSVCIKTHTHTEREREREDVCAESREKERENSNFLKNPSHAAMMAKERRERKKNTVRARSHSPWQSRSLPPELESVPLALLRAFFLLLFLLRRC